MIRRSSRSSVIIYNITLAFSLWLCLAKNVSSQTQSFINVERVQDGNLVYLQYEFKERKTVDLSDLILSEELTKQNAYLPYPLSSTWSVLPDFKLLLLENGMAKLRDVDNAPTNYKKAQTKAMNQHTGIWKPPPSPPQTVAKQPEQQKNPESGINWTQVWDFLLKWGIILSTIGVVGSVIGVVSRNAYRKLYIQRKVRLIIIGEPSAGKSALYHRLLDPKVSRSEILKLEATPSPQRAMKNQFIPKGKFEIYPILDDIPGNAYGTTWDELSEERKHALLLVLAPTGAQRGNGNFDDKYVYTQLGIVKAYIGGSFGSHSTKKPKVLIVFLNKFDLLSVRHPEDSASEEKNEEIHQIFADHIHSMKFAADKADIPIHVIVGSALENWNCERIIEVVGQELYGF